MNEEFNLIHFTSFFTSYKKETNRDINGFNNLLGIIENGFRFTGHSTFTPIESNDKSGISLRIGMICFTEVRHIDICRNLHKFGKFGICMKREWVKKFSGQPVLYSFDGSVNNKLLFRLQNLISTTQNLYQEIGDDRIEKISLSIADISNHLQAITEVIDHKQENEWRIIDDPQNEVLQKTIIPFQIIEHRKKSDIYSANFYLPISSGDDSVFYILPKDYIELFCNKVVNRISNEKKIVVLEELMRE